MTEDGGGHLPVRALCKILVHEIVRDPLLQLFLGRVVTNHVQSNLVEFGEAGKLVSYLKRVSSVPDPSSHIRNTTTRSLVRKQSKAIASNELHDQQHGVQTQSKCQFPRLGNLEGLMALSFSVRALTWSVFALRTISMSYVKYWANSLAGTDLSATLGCQRPER